MITRRQLLRVGAFGPGAAIALSLLGLTAARGAATRPVSAATVAAHSGHGATGVAVPVLAASPPAPSYQVPLPIPPTLAPTSTDATTDYYQVTMRAAQAVILPGLSTTIWGYNGLYPGPTLRATKGRRAVVRQANALPEDTVVHLHGGHIPADSDGHPSDPIAPGASRDYTYPNNQDAATLWYHDHAMMKTAPHIWQGLAGFYLLGDSVEAALNLPGGDYDVPLLVQDRQFNSDGSLYYPSDGAPGTVHGFAGDVLLVNGAVSPYFQVANRKYRFRLLNGSNVQGMTFELRNGVTVVPMAQIASDGGLLSAPLLRAAITLWPAERAEVVIDFSSFPLGTQLFLKNTAGGTGLADVLRFDVVRNEADPSTLPAALRPFTPLSAADAVITRSVVLGFDVANGVWTLNGNTYDPARIDAQPILGTTEIWRFVNTDAVTHPLHLHHSPLQILDRNGVPPSATSGEVGWKDTVAVAPGETVRVLIKFPDYTGAYVFHCHKLEHEDHEMMGQFKVVRTFALTIPIVSGGSATPTPAGSTYVEGTSVSIAAAANNGMLFTGWSVDGAAAGWANPLTITINAAHTAAPSFAAVPVFCDVPASAPYYTAVTQLAARGIIKGYDTGCFGPDDTTLRAQMAALIARAMGWDAEDWGNPFIDQGAVDNDLWRNVGTLAHYNVARGYGDGTFGPTDPVLQAQTISFITRAMVAKGYWAQQADNPAYYPEVPSSSGHREDIATYVTYAGTIPGTAAPTASWPSWQQPATRSWFALSEWQALDAYFKVDRVA
jgi:spore coat protein A